MRTRLLADQHLFTPAPARNDADANFDKPHIQFGMGLHGGAMQQELTATAQCQACWGGDDRKRCKLNRLHRGLALCDQFLDHWPHADIGGE